MDVYGLIGNPVGHSLSPPMHEAGYNSLGLEARYLTFEPDPTELQSAIQGADALGVGGLNVTIPFKQDVLELVDPAPLAKRIGAVNTIEFTDDGPRGYNTDAIGVTRALNEHGITIDDRNAVVVGAGGAGRAAAFGLADAGSSVHIANRTAERARDLADEVPGATGAGLDSLADRLSGADLLVNATSVGMEEAETPVPAELLHPELTVLDAVYTPIETQLLRDATDTGANTVEGAWMLLFQGVEAFERWTGEEAPVRAMNDALRSHLTEHS